MVLNLERDPECKATKDPNMRSFTVRPFDEVGKRLTAAGVGFEFAEYLKGETHYIVITIKKVRRRATCQREPEDGGMPRHGPRPRPPRARC